MQELELRVANVKCGGCASAIQDGLRALPGVTSIEVDITTGTVRIGGIDFDTTAIEAKLSELGYPVSP